MSAPASWLASRGGAAGYLIGWLTFGVGFAAAFWLARPDLARAAKSTALVVTPAALLGTAAVWACNRLPLVDRRRTWLLAVHAALAFTFAAAWIASVGLVNAGLRGGAAAFGPPPAHILHWHLLAGALLYAVLASVTLGHRRTVAAERERAAAEMTVLQGQLNPHFLFNSLHAIFALTRADPGAGEAALDRFTRLLQYVLRIHRERLHLVSLEEELAFTRTYLDLERLRYAEVLRVECDVDDELLDCAVPPLILQPLAENAVRHAVGRSSGGALVRISARRDGQRVLLRVEDDGPGAALMDALESRGIGLRSVRIRLQALHGADPGCAIETAPGRGFAVTLTIPDTALAPGGPA